MMMAGNSDPLGINARLYKQLGRLLDEMEKWDDTLTIPQRINALIAVGRIQVMFMGLRKESNDSGREGRSVRKYAAAFKNAARRGAPNAGRSGPGPDDDPAFDAEDDIPA
jgi:hypothetical protein